MKDLFLILVAILGISFSWWMKILIRKMHFERLRLNLYCIERDEDRLNNKTNPRKIYIGGNVLEIDKITVSNSTDYKYKVKIKYFCSRNFKLDGGDPIKKGPADKFEYTLEEEIERGEYYMPLPIIDKEMENEEINFSVEMTAYMSVVEFFRFIPIHDYVEIKREKKEVVIVT